MSDQEREKIAYDSDLTGVVRIQSGATVTDGHIVKFGTGGKVLDGGKSASDLVTPSEMSSAISSAIDSATDEIWSSIKSVEAWRAYGSQNWSSGTSYSVGDLCIHGGAGYKCKTDNSSPTFDPAQWEEVLTSSGKAAIDVILGRFSDISNIAPDFDENETYSEGMLAFKDGELKVCTVGGVGESAIFVPGTVEDAITARISALSSDIQKGVDAYGRGYVSISGSVVKAEQGSTEIELANKSSLSEKADSESIDRPYNSSRGYSVDDTCTHEGKWWKCISAVSSGSAFDESSWEEITVKGALAGGATQVNADWDETEPSDPAYIKNKPAILSPYSIEQISAVNPGDEGYLDNRVSYRLKDRTVNVLKPLVGVSENIRLIAPQPLQSNLARDFVVVICARAKTSSVSGDDYYGSSSGSDSSDPHDDQSDGDNVEIEFDESIECYDSRMNVSSLTAVLGSWISYKFVETGLGYQSVFLVTGFSDPAYQKALEIDRALDAILMDGGAGGDFDGGFYIPGDDGKLHRVEAVTDEFGDVNISVEKEGVVR